MLSSVPFLSSRSPCLVQQQIPLFHYQNDVSFGCHYCASSNLLRNSGKKSRSLVLFKAGLWDYMRSSLSNINTSPVSERPSEMEDEDIVEEYEPEEIVLDEKEQENGMLEKIVFISGKEVDINDVQKLCSKVFLLVEFIPERIGRLAKEAYCKNFNSTQEQLYGSYLIFNKSVSSHRNKMVLCWALLFQLDGEIQRVLIGMARATSDHVFNATIWDVVVDPLYQGRGLGKALIQQMIHTLLKRDIANITLFSDAQVVDFYRNLGFEADAGGVRGMFWYPKL